MSYMHSTLWNLSSILNIFEPHKPPPPFFGLPQVSCHMPMLRTVLEITKTREFFSKVLILTDAKNGLISSVISNDVRFFQLSGLQVFDACSGISGQFKLVPQPQRFTVKPSCDPLLQPHSSKVVNISKFSLRNFVSIF